MSFLVRYKHWWKERKR